MLFKIFGIERASRTAAGESGAAFKPRQLFVTQSRVLATRVEEYFTKLTDSLEMACKPLDEIQHVVSQRNIAEKGEELVDLDEEEWRGDLPKRFSDLQDHHFPLFITFDKVRSNYCKSARLNCD